MTNYKLKGITWNHSRGYLPVVATAQRFCELNPGVEIIWSRRSLQEFADKSIAELAEEFDLLVIDHPWAGYASESGAILPLNNYLGNEYIRDQQTNTVGKSTISYEFNGLQWALAVDAATPVASSRPDLIGNHALPRTLDDLFKLAQTGKVAIPGIPIDTLMNFYMFCQAVGEEPFLSRNNVVNDGVGIKVLKLMRQLSSLIDPIFFDMNPIQVYEIMTSTNNFIYCPFAYGYSNYARSGYAANLLHFHDLIEVEGYGKLKSTLGGTGLAVSAKSGHIDIAMKYVAFTGSESCQRTIYFENGGQPGHRTAWLDEETNRQTAGYFSSTLPALDRAYMRPRYPNYMHFQDNAGDPIRDYLMHGGNEHSIIEEINKIYRESVQ